MVAPETPALTPEQKACAMDKLSEMMKVSDVAETKIYFWTEIDGKERWNVTFDWWYADHQWDTLEEAIIDAYETYLREWKDQDE